jgi:hypothetical protein
MSNGSMRGEDDETDAKVKRLSEGSVCNFAHFCNPQMEGKGAERALSA